MTNNLLEQIARDVEDDRFIELTFIALGVLLAESPLEDMVANDYIEFNHVTTKAAMFKGAYLTASDLVAEFLEESNLDEIEDGHKLNDLSTDEYRELVKEFQSYVINY